MRILKNWLRHGADAAGGWMLGAIFVVFVLQVFFRYVINDPLGWTLEACLTLWIWLVFWGGAFMLAPHEHVTFDMLYEVSGRRTRRVFALISALSIVAGFAVSLVPTWSFISFYAIQDSPTLGIPLNVVFSIYAVFAVAAILRYGWRAICLIRGASPDPEIKAP